MNELKFQVSADDSTVTPYDDEENFHHVASVGAYEIVKIDTMNKEIELNIDARAGDENFINGKVTVPICY